MRTAELRTAIAAHVNRLYRKGKRSQYTAANVCVAQGGRLALTRIFAALGEGNVGYQLPDYTAYEDMFALQLARVQPVPIRVRPEDGFQLPIERIGDEIDEKGLSAFLLSNPCNPTGNVIQGRDLAALVGAVLVLPALLHGHLPPAVAHLAWIATVALVGAPGALVVASLLGRFYRSQTHALAWE